MRITVLASMLFFLVPARLIPQSDLLRKEIEKIIKYENTIDYNVVPGVLIGIIDGDHPFQFKFGKDINPDGIFELGSLTKPFVSWLANKALGSLNMDRFASVCTFLPDSLYIDTWKNITYDQIIEHKAGLPRLPPGIGAIEEDVTDPYKDYSIHMLARDIKLIEPKGGQYSYSH